MASDNRELDADVSVETQEELLRAIEDNADELAELLRMLAVTENLAADLTPELRETVRQNREPLSELRTAFEREETLALLTKVGEEAETLLELLDVLVVSKGLVDDLAPELRVAVRENREVLERLRLSLEDEQMIVLLERLNDNADTLVEMLELLDATHDLATDLMPELRSVAQDNRDVLREFRMAAAGFMDAHAENDVEMYQVGRNAANMFALVETLGDPKLTRALDATVDGLAQEDPEPVGILGLIKALFDADVRRALGRLLAGARSLGSVDLDDVDQ